MSEQFVSPILQKAGRGIDGFYTTATLILGGFYQDWLLIVVNWSTLQWIVLGLFAVFVPLGIILHAKARQYLNPMTDGLVRFGDGLANIVIGGVGMAWVSLAIGMGPFYLEAPVVILPVALYFLLIVDVFWLKRTVRKASKLILVA